MNPLLIFFAKAPDPGRVKTRLIPILGETAASQLQEAFILDLLRSTDSLPIDRAVACDPDPDHPFFLKCGRDHPLRFVQQRGSDLGERMKNAFTWGFAEGFSKVLLIGCDLPTLPVDFVGEAIDRLDAVSVVLGPSVDGGYYLIGGRPPVPDLFEGIDWGTGQVLAATLQKLATQQTTCHLLPFWYDIDRPEELPLLKAHLALLKRQGRLTAKETWNTMEQWTQGI